MNGSARSRCSGSDRLDQFLDDADVCEPLTLRSSFRKRVLSEISYSLLYTQDFDRCAVSVDSQTCEIPTSRRFWGGRATASISMRSMSQPRGYDSGYGASDVRAH